MLLCIFITFVTMELKNAYNFVNYKFSSEQDISNDFLTRVEPCKSYKDELFSVRVTGPWVFQDISLINSRKWCQFNFKPHPHSFASVPCAGTMAA